jgi:hypothetical protein
MTDREPDPPPEHNTGELVLAEEGGVRVFYISASTMPDLVDRLALVLGEHMHNDDELHVTYNAMQNSWQKHAPRKGSILKAPQSDWTELHFEDSAFLVLQRAVLRQEQRPHRARREEQEISMLARHLLQSALVHINTLLVERVLREPAWASRLTDADRRALTPLFWTHVNPYGKFMLDMDGHLDLDPPPAAATPA